MWCHQLRGVLQVLLEPQLKGLPNGADHILRQALRALQDMAGWGGNGGMGAWNPNVKFSTAPACPMHPGASSRGTQYLPTTLSCA